MLDTDLPERVGLTVPLETVGSSSPGRTRLALAIWTIGLAGIAWIGLAGHEAAAPLDAAPVAAPVAAIPAPVPPTATATLSRGTVRYVAAPVGVRHTFGEDGLIGGIVFGDNVPRLSQADIERDGYRYYHALIGRDPTAGSEGSP